MSYAITAQAPAEIEIISAALDRAKAQALLEVGTENGAPTWTMRQRQRAVNQADRRITAAANTMLAAEILAPVLSGEDKRMTAGNDFADIENYIAEVSKLRAAIKRFRNADTEFLRAQKTGEQPRLNKAGTRYAVAKYGLFRTAGFK